MSEQSLLPPLVDSCPKRHFGAEPASPFQTMPSTLRPQLPQEQLDELQARKDAVAALKTEVKDTQKDIADLMDEQKMKEDELAECKEKIAEIETKIK